mgnify:CR=1 FL=1
MGVGGNNRSDHQWCFLLLDVHKLYIVIHILLNMVETTKNQKHITPTMTTGAVSRLIEVINDLTPLVAGLAGIALKSMLFAGVAVFSWCVGKLGVKVLYLPVTCGLLRLGHMGLMVTISNTQEILAVI